MSKKGRPRSPVTQKSILDASYGLLLENGFDDITIEKIAERAGVSKATIYKWWPNKAAVVMDGFFSAAADRLPIPDTGSVYEDVLIHATNLARFMVSPDGKSIKELIGQGQLDSTLKEAIQTHYIQPRRSEAMQLLERGVRSGELNAGLNLALGVDLLYGPMFYRMLVTSGSLDDEGVKDIVMTAFNGLKAGVDKPSV
ncbi:TetR/AcrR family transcriptional regulator [Paenibacillus sacheonensis]|uniref:TetR family transcriptional regulator n=1 Tax=Paenibacillus sacheonensis TaxID=742054 RepID=A0A7X4YQB2_9BACL|nr:TetR/AcrR family transcriptional regulator [Paenibacillus sacheonensis]MBM7566384.1 AcrR family transcriptional regulator [Paenibacillus sacheonensis]NBC70586.1 TetR family transcriptional regulator [Paenibacillus sacheonensis]